MRPVVTGSEHYSAWGAAERDGSGENAIFAVRELDGEASSVVQVGPKRLQGEFVMGHEKSALAIDPAVQGVVTVQVDGPMLVAKIPDETVDPADGAVISSIDPKSAWKT